MKMFSLVSLVAKLTGVDDNESPLPSSVNFHDSYHVKLSIQHLISCSINFACCPDVL
uniref:Uncharacterized protein n=1 Tax=Arion vulgaris TaxID=1028688 RepID=A0A0B7B984_9EUPU